MIRYLDDHYPTDNYKWSILNSSKAEELHLGLLEVEKDSNVLTIDVKYIPDKMSLDEFIQYIQSNKIAVNNIRKPNNRKQIKSVSRK